jgi:hypothetical protein
MEKLNLKCEYSGYEIRWTDFTRKFKIFKEGILVKEDLDTLKESQIWIDSENRKKFKRTPILYNFRFTRDDMDAGEATSLVDDELVWLVSGRNRCKVHPKRVWLDTPENRELVKDIKEKYSQIDQIREEIAKIKTKATCLTKEMLLCE